MQTRPLSGSAGMASPVRARRWVAGLAQIVLFVREAVDLRAARPPRQPRCASSTAARWPG